MKPSGYFRYWCYYLACSYFDTKLAKFFKFFIEEFAGQHAIYVVLLFIICHFKSKMPIITADKNEEQRN